MSEKMEIFLTKSRNGGMCWTDYPSIRVGVWGRENSLEECKKKAIKRHPEKELTFVRLDRL